MPIMERDIVLTGRDGQGNETFDFPVTRLGLLEGTAEIKEAMEQADYIPLVVGQKVMMVPASTLLQVISDATKSLVPATRKINGKALSADVTLSAADVKARSNTWTPTAAEVGAVPTSRTVNGKALSTNVTLFAEDIGALPAPGTAAAATKLETARTIRTNLASTSTASFDGTANVTPSVTGTLPVANGGTGAVSSAAAMYNLVNALSALTSTGLATGDYLPLLDASGATGKKVTLTNLKTWLQNQNIGARIATGSYTGTGTYGASNPCSLTFSFSPHILMLFDAIGSIKLQNNTSSSGNSPAAIGLVSALTTAYTEDALFGHTSHSSDSKFYYPYAKKSSDGKTVSWYHTRSDLYQFNTKGEIYKWVAIG